jgi:hypothetical protein
VQVVPGGAVVPVGVAQRHGRLSGPVSPVLLKEVTDAFVDVPVDRQRGVEQQLSTAGQAMAQARSRRQGGEGGEGDDVADRIGRPIEAHQEAGDAIAAALLPVLGRIAALAAPSMSPTVEPGRV